MSNLGNLKDIDKDVIRLNVRLFSNDIKQRATLAITNFVGHWKLVSQENYIQVRQVRHKLNQKKSETTTNKFPGKSTASARR